ncbi:MAG: hypothetical protein CMC79_00950 [Flavobacteriaceae bacterium]|nr:hypothetical protein [Flavobacteriaceae bacterium]|tara:strand:- start:305 stop:1036 length:732 start_codon:yes stop_codon:yes gene_type:complete
MRKLILDGTVIFISIFASFSVENYRESIAEKNILNDAVITLGEEMISNIDYTKEHLNQVKNMHHLNNEIINNYNNISAKEIFTIHSDNPYVHNFTIDGKITYVKKYHAESLLNLLVSWNAWEPEKVFFESMLNSGKLLEIKNKKLRKEIESIYTKQQERVDGMAKATKNNTNLIADWFLDTQNNYNYDISNNKTFNNFKDQKLKNLLKNKEFVLELRINDIENYLQAIQNVVLLISTEYKKLD